MIKSITKLKKRMIRLILKHPRDKKMDLINKFSNKDMIAFLNQKETREN